MVYIGLIKGWLSIAKEILANFLPANDLPPLVVAEVAAPEGGLVEGRSVADSSRCLQKLRHKCQGEARLACTLLAKPLSSKLMTAMGLLVSITRRYHGQYVVMAKKQDGRRRRRAHMAASGWQVEITDIFAKLSDVDALMDVGWVLNEGASCQRDKDVDDAVAAHFHNFVVHVLRHRFLWMCDLSFGPPNKFVTLLSDDASLKTACLTDLREWWRCLHSLEVASNTDPEARSFHDSLVWPRWVWVREVMVVLEECD